METAIAKWGNSHGVRLPRTLMDTVGFSEGDRVDVRVEGDGIVIRKCAAQKTLDDFFAGYDGAYRPGETDWGAPVGGEVW